MSDKLTRAEERIMDILREHGGPITTTDLVKLFYGRHPPRHGQTSLIGILNRLSDKTKNTNERVVRSVRAGQAPGDVWIETGPP